MRRSRAGRDRPASGCRAHSKGNGSIGLGHAKSGDADACVAAACCFDKARLHAPVAEHMGGQALGFPGEAHADVPRRNLVLNTAS